MEIRTSTVSRCYKVCSVLTSSLHVLSAESYPWRACKRNMKSLLLFLGCVSFCSCARLHLDRNGLEVGGMQANDHIAFSVTASNQNDAIHLSFQTSGQTLHGL
ncbi:hypothetical protein ScPMuIL_009148 [Solemya velum]